VVTRSVPQSIKLGLTASIGLFVAVLGFRNAGLVLANAKTNALMLGDFLSRRAGGAVRPVPGDCPAGAAHPGRHFVGDSVCHPGGDSGGVTHLPDSFIAMPHSLAPVLRPRRYAGRAEHRLPAVPVCLFRL
jgi:AGZA family xanthine/uracil permease-like MFS transporter